MKADRFALVVPTAGTKRTIFLSFILEPVEIAFGNELSFYLKFSTQSFVVRLEIVEFLLHLQQLLLSIKNLLILFYFPRLLQDFSHRSELVKYSHNVASL